MRKMHLLRDTAFARLQERLFGADMARAFAVRLRARVKWRGLISGKQLGVDGSLIEACAWHRRAPRCDPDKRRPPIGGERNATAGQGRDPHGLVAACDLSRPASLNGYLGCTPSFGRIRA